MFRSSLITVIVIIEYFIIFFIPNYYNKPKCFILKLQLNWRDLRCAYILSIIHIFYFIFRCRKEDRRIGGYKYILGEKIWVEINSLELIIIAIYLQKYVDIYICESPCLIVNICVCLNSEDITEYFRLTLDFIVYLFIIIYNILLYSWQLTTTGK